MQLAGKLTLKHARLLKLATWAWVRGKCEEAMREVLGAGRGVQAGEVETPAMAAEVGRAKRDEARSRGR